MRARLNLLVVTPAPAASRKGNRVTALRWAALLRQLGHHVRVVEEFRGEACDVLIALHARRSHDSVARYPRGAPLVVAMTGTDLYVDLPAGDAAARGSLELATRIVVLQPAGLGALPEAVRSRGRAIVQSACAPGVVERPADRLDVCVVGHLRAVKDPLRAALAARLLPASSTLRVVQVGGAIEPAYAAAAREEARVNPRYLWLGELPRRAALLRLAASHLMAITSLAEGGANVIGEAVVCGVPVVASRIPGSLGLLGDDYPGVYPPGDTAALAALLARFETDAPWRAALVARCDALRPGFAPEAERDAWRVLLAEIV